MALRTARTRWAVVAGSGLLTLPVAAQTNQAPPGDVAAQAAQTERAWRLVWSDEFSLSSLDTTKWRAEDVTLVKNNELQSYAPSAVSIRNGMLVISSTVAAKDDDREPTP